MEKQAVKWLQSELDGPNVKVVANEDFPADIRAAYKAAGVKGPDAIVFDRKNKTIFPVDSTTRASSTHEAKTIRDKNILEQNLPQRFKDEGVTVGSPGEILTDSSKGTFKLVRGK
jgi:hypothetical protein